MIPGQPQAPLGADQNAMFQQQQSATLARALAAMQQSGQQSKTPGAVGTNLLADALLQYGQGQQGQAQAARSYGASPGGYAGQDPLSSPLGQQSQGQAPGWLSPFMQMGQMGAQ